MKQVLPNTQSSKIEKIMEPTYYEARIHMYQNLMGKKKNEKAVCSININTKTLRYGAK